MNLCFEFQSADVRDSREFIPFHLERISLQIPGGFGNDLLLFGRWCYTLLLTLASAWKTAGQTLFPKARRTVGTASSKA